jgi:hypothetical protein
LLSYWNFNNVESIYTDPNFGEFKSSPASYGECYDSSSKHLSANTSSSTVFSGENIYLDLSQLSGGMVSDSRAASAWGVFTDTPVNRVLYDPSYNESEGGSLMVVAGKAHNHITFVLSSRGYDRLSFSYAGRDIKKGNAIEWSWSTDGSNFAPIENIQTPEAFGRVLVNLSNRDGLGLDALNNQDAVYLRATLVFKGEGGTLALDNFQFTGFPIKK